MKIETDLIADGKMDGEYVWICDYRLKDPSNKPIRAVKPQKVLVRSNGETKKGVYYSDSHFVALKSDGSPTSSKIIGLFDNTGYRSYRGVPVNVFTTEMECRDMYRTLLKKAVGEIQEVIDQLNSRIDVIVKEAIEQ